MFTDHFITQQAGRIAHQQKFSRFLALVIGIVFALGVSAPSPAAEPHASDKKTASLGTGTSHDYPDKFPNHESKLNWWSLSFGEGKKYQNGPIAWSIFNFLVLLGLLAKFAGKPFKDFLANRHETIRTNLIESQKMREEARLKLQQVKHRLDNLDQKIAEIKLAVVQDARYEQERIIQTAKQEAQRIIQQADLNLEKEVKRAHQLLEAEAVNAALQAAEKLIKSKISETDRNRINQEFFEQIDLSGGVN